MLEAVGDDAGVVDACLLIQSFLWVVLADHDGEVAGGIKEYLVAADSEDRFQRNGLTMAG
jgi:hypothetical protein